MTFWGLFKKETDLGELTWQVRSLLSAVRAGRPVAEAAEEVGVTPTHLRQLQRSPVFLHHLRQARAEPQDPGPLLELVGERDPRRETEEWWERAEGKT
jgi:hypothetical protein